MLKYLIIMRHAKSSWSDTTLSDHERPLNKRGREAADLMARALSARGYAPDIIWSSDSTRTKETALRMIRQIPGAQTVRYFSDFYHGTIDDVVRVCTAEVSPDTLGCNSLMVLGHNPGWSELCDYYGGTEGRSILRNFGGFPTAACAIYKRRDGQREREEWFDPSAWRPIALLRPKDLNPDIFYED